jgi:hypothetical protein
MGVRAEDRHLLFDGAVAVSSREFLLMRGIDPSYAKHAQGRAIKFAKNFKRGT